MSIYSNGSKVGSLYKNGKKIDSIYKNGKMIFLSNRNQLSEVSNTKMPYYWYFTNPWVSSDGSKMLISNSSDNILLDISKTNITKTTIHTASGSAFAIMDDDDNIVYTDLNSICKVNLQNKTIVENDSLVINNSSFCTIEAQNSIGNYLVYLNSDSIAILRKNNLSVISSKNFSGSYYESTFVNGCILCALNDTVMVLDENTLKLKSSMPIGGQNSAVGISSAKNSIFVFNSDYPYFLKYELNSGVLSNPQKITTKNRIIWSSTKSDGNFVYFQTYVDNIIHKLNSDGKEISSFKMPYPSEQSIFANRKNIYLTYNADGSSTNICHISQY